MIDAPPTDAPTPQDEDEEEENDEGDEDDDRNDAEEAPTPSRSERASQSATPRRRGQRGKPRRGRPSRVHNLKTEASDDGNEASDTPAPKRRGGFRGHRGGRWANRRGGNARSAQAPVDDEGNALNVVDDEIELPDDPEGEAKINKNGELLGGREYRVRTFTLLGRGKRLYMLSTEPARCIGFRDSYLFFQKHKHLYKIIIDDDEKRDLIDRDLIPHSYKGRSIGVVTARSVFREFGAKIVIGGKKVIDDYDAAAARERGDVEGELAVPEDRVPAAGESYNRNQYVAWHGASAVYHMNLPSVPLQNSKVLDAKRKRVNVTSDNWMLEHARDSSRFNSTLKIARDENANGVYDIHTNVMQWPSHLQPTHARWEAVTGEENEGDSQSGESNSVFSKLLPIYARSFRIHDLYCESRPDTSFNDPGFGSERGLLSNITEEILKELPADCRAALGQAGERELAWRSKWLNESVDGNRASILSSVEWYPK